MNKTLLSLAAAAVLAFGFAGSAHAATAAKAPPAAATALSADAARANGGVIQAGHKFRRFGHRRAYLWKYDYRPRYVCKKHYRWVLTRYGWRNVYVGYWCDYTNNY